MKLSDILPVFLAISSVTNNVDAQCSYMNARRLNSRGSRVSRNLQAEEEEEFVSPFTYGRMVSTSEVASYDSSSVSDLIIAGNGYMNSSVRDTGVVFTGTPPRFNPFQSFRFIDKDGNITDTPTGSIVLNRATSSVSAGQAGYTYLGQLLSHDMNKDGNSVMGVPIDPESIMNKNTPHIDLDTIYNFTGIPPALVPLPGDGRLVFEFAQTQDGYWTDFPRDVDGKANITDSRDDNQVVLAGITKVLMLAHNQMMIFEDMNFEEARSEMEHTWRSIVRYDLMPKLFDNDVISEVFAAEGYDKKLYTGDMAANDRMPVEFSAAAYRTFHSRLNGAYQTQGNGRFWSVFPDSDTPRDQSLMGGKQVPSDQDIEWTCFFGTGFECNGPNATNPAGSPPNSGRKLDVSYESVLTKMPTDGPGVPDNQTQVADGLDSVKHGLTGEDFTLTNEDTGEESLVANLATIDLVRSETVKVPGGIGFATYAKETLGLNIEIYTMEEMAASEMGLPAEYYPSADLPIYAPSLPTDVPLEIYLLHESIFENDGLVLGRLGSFICVETIAHFLDAPGNNDTWVSAMTNSSEVTFMELVDWIGEDNDQFGGGWAWGPNSDYEPPIDVTFNFCGQSCDLQESLQEVTGFIGKGIRTIPGDDEDEGCNFLPGLTAASNLFDRHLQGGFGGAFTCKLEVCVEEENDFTDGDCKMVSVTFECDTSSTDCTV